MLADARSVFLLGLAAGLSLLALTSYRRVSPAGLRWLLFASVLCVFSRYVAPLTALPEPQRHLLYWPTALAGFILPSIFGIDQLVRHPAMTPQKLFVRVGPFIVAASMAAPFPVACRLLQGFVALAFVTIALLLSRKIPSRPIQLGLWALAAGQSALALDSLYAEMAMLLALWFAYETAASLQQ